jgi:hypothetical protein
MSASSKSKLSPWSRLAAVACVAANAALCAGQYSLAWWTIDAGGVMSSTGGTFTLSGTTGQPDAARLTGGTFELTGGFWVTALVPATCAGDGNCDYLVNWRDIDYLIAAQNDNLSAWTALFPAPGPSCAFLNLDTSADGHVNWRDIDPFIALMNTTCP